MSLTYFRTAERPDLQFWLLDDDGALINFSTGYTFAWRLGVPGAAASFEKTTGITGAAGAGAEPAGTPNILLTFTADELEPRPVLRGHNPNQGRDCRGRPIDRRVSRPKAPLLHGGGLLGVPVLAAHTRPRFRLGDCHAVTLVAPVC